MLYQQLLINFGGKEITYLNNNNNNNNKVNSS